MGQTQASNNASQSTAANRTGNQNNAYNPPGPVEVYHLNDTANSSIPEHIREQFQRDDQGHVLFFTTPPQDILPPVREGAALSHTPGYLARRARQIREKRFGTQSAEAARKAIDPNSPNAHASAQPPPEKKTKTEEPAEPVDPVVAAEERQRHIADLQNRALGLLCDQIYAGTCAIYKADYGDRWEEVMLLNEQFNHAQQLEQIEKNKRLEESAKKREEDAKVKWNSLEGNRYLDDMDPRY